MSETTGNPLLHILRGEDVADELPKVHGHSARECLRRDWGGTVLGKDYAISYHTPFNNDHLPYKTLYQAYHILKIECGRDSICEDYKWLEKVRNEEDENGDTFYTWMDGAIQSQRDWILRDEEEEEEEEEQEEETMVASDDGGDEGKDDSEENDSEKNDDGKIVKEEDGLEEETNAEVLNTTNAKGKPNKNRIPLGEGDSDSGNDNNIEMTDDSKILAKEKASQSTSEEPNTALTKIPHDEGHQKGQQQPQRQHRSEPQAKSR
ncbi:MAG: hypothetical protein Q9218_005646 [Villophora microphyllina]